MEEQQALMNAMVQQKLASKEESQEKALASGALQEAGRKAEQRVREVEESARAELERSATKLAEQQQTATAQQQALDALQGEARRAQQQIGAAAASAEQEAAEAVRLRGKLVETALRRMRNSSLARAFACWQDVLMQGQLSALEGLVQAEAEARTAAEARVLEAREHGAKALDEQRRKTEDEQRARKAAEERAAAEAAQRAHSERGVAELLDKQRAVEGEHAEQIKRMQIQARRPSSLAGFDFLPSVPVLARASLSCVGRLHMAWVLDPHDACTQ